MTLAEQLVRLATARGVMIATAESCTGGLLAGAITDVPGASAVLDRGWVTYTNVSKQAMLGVGSGLIAQHGAVSEEVARAMAIGALHRSLAHVAVAVSGIAGPGGSESKPEGRVCFSVTDGIGNMVSTVEFGAIGRAQVRQAAVYHALEMLLEAIQEARNS
jgi:nicotinamide-nucleotide amidase